MTEPGCKLDIFFARRSSKAAILRRGPKRHVRLILWDRDTDDFEDGQWLKARIYPECCDLSPDGRHFLFFARDERPHRREMTAWTAISCPPWLTALALFPGKYLWSGGGFFLDESRYVIRSDFETKDMIGRAEGLERVFECEPEGKNTLGYVHRDGRRVNLRAEDVARFESGEERAPVDAGYHVERGKLFRRLAGGDLSLIRDFADMTFEPLRAPYDDRPPTGAEPLGPSKPWHPLGGDDP